MKIYVSYSLAPTDLYIASMLARQAQAKGVVVETAQHIAPGSNWAAIAAHPIASSDVVVAIVSRDSQNILNVERELGIALSYSKPVLALVEHGLHAQINVPNVQYVEFDRRNLGPALARIGAILEGRKNQDNAGKWLVAGGLALLALYLIGQESEENK
ncbi:MAG: toll/interleukin-1 receptor domain-containing protein [Acidobacteriota bacterium]|nr:toll/interleukin-1 receptor domain-containing protein [Acidobacteriota bacterium]